MCTLPLYLIDFPRTSKVMLNPNLPSQQQSYTENDYSPFLPLNRQKSLFISNVTTKVVVPLEIF